MNWFIKAFSSSLGRKIIMSLTGLFLISFLVVHLSGNFLLLKSDEGAAFNLYSNFMSTNGLIRFLELGLVAGFLMHIYNAFTLTRKNSEARPQKYAFEKASTNSSWFSRNMGLSGSIILIFLLVHLWNFWYAYKFGSPEKVMIDGMEYKNMYALVAAAFSQWWYVALYVGAMVLLGFHLNHGFQSAFQSLGLNHKKYTPLITFLGSAIAILIPFGFAIIPVLFFAGLA